MDKAEAKMSEEKKEVKRKKKPTRVVPNIPELLKKKEERDKKNYEELTKERKEVRLKNKAKVDIYIKNAQKWWDEYIKEKKEIQDLKRKAKHEGNFFVPTEPKVAFIIRLKGINTLHPKIRKVLQLFRLRQLYNGTFVKVNKATMNMIHIIEPFITYGFPSRETIAKLIYKRGFLKHENQRIHIENNHLIEEHLGKFGIICVEDLIHEIYSCGPHFKEANNLLWTFKLKPPKKGFSEKRHPFVLGGDWGNREELINDLVIRML